ncbi:hypothetical protein [Phenylobacterium sp.]|jgi:hypothetical protein|uniref:hypothetical protein n=1 Tax=Phenylobacterium sp. TaxID=1871053 RepID=UPI002F412ABD
MAGLSVAGSPHAVVKHPDFTGLWTSASLTGMERPDDFKSLVVTEAEAAKYEKAHRGKPPDIPPGDPDHAVGGVESEWWETDVGLARIRGQVRTSWIVAPADGQLPISPAAKAFFKARRETRKIDFDNPEGREASERCIETDGAGPPYQNGGYNDNLEMVLTGEHLVMHSEWMSSLRIVRLGAKDHLPAAMRVPGGDSIAHWEGETLVVETTNFPARDVDDPKGDPKADMKTVERFTRVGPDELLYAFRVTNPAVFTQTWAGEMVLRRAVKPMYEYACHEGNYGLANMLAGARHVEAEAAKAHARSGG